MIIMNLLCLQDIDPKNIYFLETKKNIIIDGTFTKIIYTHPYFTMNGLYFHLPDGIKSDNGFNGSFMNIYIHDINKEWCSKIERIEREILKMYAVSKLSDLNQPSFLLQKQFKTGFLKTYKESFATSFIMKISGVWETQTEYGITYKIIRGEKV